MISLTGSDLRYQALDDDGGVLPGPVLRLAEHDAAHQRVAEHHLRGRHRRLVLRVRLVQQDGAADGALRGTPDNTNMILIAWSCLFVKRLLVPYPVRRVKST